MSDHIKQQVLQELFTKKVSFSWETEKLDLDYVVLPEVGEPAHISKISYLFGVKAAWHTVLICFTMCGTEQPKNSPK